MGLFKKLSGLFAPAPGREAAAYWIYVRCGRCGEALQARLDLYNELSADYEAGEGQAAYFARKTLIGSKRCFQPVEVELIFDERRKLVDRKIRGGEFVSEEEFLAGQKAEG